MDVGHKLKQDKAEKHAAKLAPALADGEEIVFMGICNNLRPTVDRLIVTNQRLLAAHSMDAAPKWESSHTLLLDVGFNQKKQTVTVHTANGAEQVFKMVRPEDHDTIRAHLNAFRSERLAGTGIADDVRKDLAESAAAAAVEAAAPTTLQAKAIAEGFPEKHRHLVEPLLAHLDSAAQAAARGDVPAEERAIWDGRQLARKAGLIAVKGPKWYDERVLERARRGDLRRGADLLGIVGADLTIMSDRIVQRGRAYVLDADVRASVEVDGQILQSSRPTMTRMAFGSILPGSALLVGLAMPKTETKDSRRAQFILVHPAWRIEERLDPDNAHQLTGLAGQVNAIAESRQRREASAAASQVAAPATPTAAARAETSTPGGLAEELTKLASLRDAGILTDEEFAAAKARLLA